MSAVTALAATSLPGGRLLNARIASAASTNATSVKPAPGTLYGIHVHNTSAAAKFLKLYNKASAPTVGTDTPVLTVPIAAGVSRDINFGDIGLAFSLGIAYAITNLVADSDTTVVAANDVVGGLQYC
jgi:hypothetical protein